MEELLRELDFVACTDLIVHAYPKAVPPEIAIPGDALIPDKVSCLQGEVVRQSMDDGDAETMLVEKGIHISNMDHGFIGEKKIPIPLEFPFQCVFESESDIIVFESTALDFSFIIPWLKEALLDLQPIGHPKKASQLLGLLNSLERP